MPFARTWSEELVAEWLQLEGYLVEIGVPVHAIRAGGRFTADVVGAKLEGNSLKIIHIEVGTLSSGKASVQKLVDKFSPEVERTLTNYITARVGINDSIDYERLYISTFSTRPVIIGAKAHGIRVMPLKEFIEADVIPSIKKWKENPPHKPKTKGNLITLPDGLWLLAMLDSIIYGKIKLTSPV